MTGYAAVLRPYVRGTQNNLIPLQDFTLLVYTIHDGERVGQKSPFYVGAPMSNVREPEIQDYGAYRRRGNFFSCYNIYDEDFSFLRSSTEDEQCIWMWHISNYTSKYGLSANRNGSSDYDGKDLIFITPNGSQLVFPNATPLNISASFSFGPQRAFQSDKNNAWYQRPYGLWNPNASDTHGGATSFPRYYHRASGEILFLDKLLDRASCQQVAEESSKSLLYTWGFNYALLFLFLITSLIWTAGTFTLYILCYWYSRLNANHRSLNTERAILELSVPMHEKLDARETLFHSDQRIQTTLSKHFMTYSELCRVYPIPSRAVQFSRWRSRSGSRSWFR